MLLWWIKIRIIIPQRHLFIQQISTLMWQWVGKNKNPTMFYLFFAVNCRLRKQQLLCLVKISVFDVPILIPLKFVIPDHFFPFLLKRTVNVFSPFWIIICRLLYSSLQIQTTHGLSSIPVGHGYYLCRTENGGAQQDILGMKYWNGNPHNILSTR